ncbi:MAG: ammonia-forming cytochrome c nitrite reductase subunit c552 [Luteitalea sp.]|nr:ammonia-forming cytochrome c nitrite reductase subunit c552 [Luteitalea sp.]
MSLSKSVSRASIVLGVSLLASGAVGYLGVASREPSPPEQHVSYRPIQVNADGYTSSQTCKACHAPQYDAWYGSYHRTMTQVATPDAVRADFDGVRVTEVPGRPMQLERRGSQFWAEFDDPDGAISGLPSARISRQIVMTTGSHHQQVYWYRTDRGRVLGQLPGMYLIAERRWIPRSAAFLAPPIGKTASETGRWNVVCINCHATHGKPELEAMLIAPLEAPAVDTQVAELGIACEACHGPGRAHVQANRDPLRRYGLYLRGTADSTITQPVRLNPKLSSQVCGQCHGISTFFDQQDEQAAHAAGLPYKPGDDLAKTRFVVQPTQNLGAPTMQKLLASDPDYIKRSFWADGMVRVSGREYNGLIDSPCFTDAREETRTLSCFSCHTMHKRPEDPRSVGEWAQTHQVSMGLDGNQACVQCHPTFKTNLTAHTRHRADSEGSSCYNCHMPYTTYGLLKALRSHQISSPTVAASVQTGRPNACNLCHLDKTLAWTADSLERWFATPKVELTGDQATVAASLLWLMTGDAGQRALVAWSMGWRPAQQTSGAGWMGPYLAELLNDRYDAVRSIAYRSLRTLPGFADFPYDFVAPPDQRLAAAVRALKIWQSEPRRDRRADRELLFSSEDYVDMEAVGRLLRQRDNRQILLRE